MNVDALVNELQTLAAGYGQDVKKITQGREPFNLFTTLLSHDDEVRLHTRFLHCLLDPTISPGGACFLRAFFKQLSAKLPVDHQGSPLGAPTFKGTEWSVQRDVYCGSDGNLDLLLLHPGCAIVIENKTRLSERPNQLKRYAGYLRKRHSGHLVLLFLTPFGDLSTTAEGESYYRISYQDHILPWIDACIRDVPGNDAIGHSLKQYRDVVRALVGQTPASAAMNELVRKIQSKADLIRHREDLIKGLNDARTCLLEQLAGDIRSGLNGYRVNSTSGREFERRPEGILEIQPPANSPLQGAPFRICIQNWSGKSLLLLGLECSEEEATKHRRMFDHMGGILTNSKFGKDGGYSTWPVGWLELEKDFNDEKLASYVDDTTRKNFKASLIEKVKTALSAIETAYGSAKHLAGCSSKDTLPGS